MFLGGSPKPRQDDDQQHRNDCSLIAFRTLTPFPRKSLRPSNRERMPPPKLPLTTISEPDPIYPYLPFLF